MSDERRPIDKIIRDWVCSLEGKRFDARVNKDSLYILIKMMAHYGYKEEDIDSELFRNRVIQRITHDFSAKPDHWKKMTKKDIDEAIGVWFLPQINFELTEEERAKIAKSEKAMAEMPKSNPVVKDEEAKAAPKYTAPVFDEKPREIIPFDRSKFQAVETTPIENGDDLLRELGLKEDE